MALTDQDRLHLARALELAELGRGNVSPNPVVGCVIARDGETIGEGYHAELGGLHAERAALADADRQRQRPAGADVFVTLEPCAHTGKQPPCADALVEASVARVVYAADDPSEKASGKGPGILGAAGIEVEAADGDEALAARLQNQAFRKHAVTGRPLVTLKSAVTLDGHTATESGDSRWISGPDSRALVHRWRAEADAIAIGIGTALSDDPLLTARDHDPPASRQPLRVVFDSTARLPLTSALIGSLERRAAAGRRGLGRARRARRRPSGRGRRGPVGPGRAGCADRGSADRAGEPGRDVAPPRGRCAPGRRVPRRRARSTSCASSSRPYCSAASVARPLLAGADPAAIGEARRALATEFGTSERRGRPDQRATGRVLMSDARRESMFAPAAAEWC